MLTELEMLPNIYEKNYDFCLESAYYSKAHISQNSQ